MAVLAFGGGTLLDFSRKVKNSTDGMQADAGMTAEYLAQTNEFLNDLHWKPCNNGTTHKARVRVALPRMYRGRYNRGVQASKSGVSYLQETTSQHESWIVIDEKILRREVDKAQYIKDEIKAHEMAMGQTKVQEFLYGDERSDDEEINGLITRYSQNVNPINRNMINFGGQTAGMQTSMLVICQHPEVIHGIYPKDSTTMGLRKKIDGITVGVSDGVGDLTGRNLRVFKASCEWEAGLFLKDWAGVVHIANVDVPQARLMRGATITDRKFTDVLLRAIGQIPARLSRLPGAKICVYVPQVIHTALIRERYATVGQAGMVYREVGGDGKADKKMEMLIDGKHPVRLVDRLGTTNGVVSF